MYQKFSDFLVESYGKIDKSALAMAEVVKNDYSNSGVELTDDEALEEVICQAAERMLLDTDAGRRLAEFGKQSAENKSFLEELKQVLKDIFDTLRRYFQYTKVDTDAAKAFARLDKKVQQTLADMLVDMSVDAGQKLSVIKAAGMLDEINTTGKGDVRFSLVIKSRDGTVTLEDPTKLSREKILNYLNLSRMGRLDEKSYFPVAAHTPEIIIETLKNAGIDITDKPLAMQAKKAKQSQNNHDIHSSNGYIIRGHAMRANEILEVIDKLYKPEAIIQETERTAKVKIDGVTELKYLPDAFVVFVHLESGKECVAVIEFDSTIDSNYIVKDGANDEYHTTITIFEPDVTRNGKPYDYYEYLIHKRGNYEIDIVEKNSNPKTAHGENLTTVSEKEFSADTVPQPEAVVKQNSSTDSDGNQLSAGQQAYFADNKSPTVDDDINNRLAVTSDNSQQEAEGVLKLAQTEDEKKLAEKLLLYVQRRKENKARRVEVVKKLHELERSGAAAEEIAKFEATADKLRERIDTYDREIHQLRMTEVLRPLIGKYERISWIENRRSMFGTIPTGEKAVRDDSLPVSTNGQNRVSRSARTVKGAAVTPDAFAEEIDEQVNNMIDKAKQTKRKLKIGVITKKHAGLLNRIMRRKYPLFDATDYSLWVDGTFAVHLEKRHGEHGLADKTMATRDAKILIPWAVQNATTGYFLHKDGRQKYSDRYFNSDHSKAPEIRTETIIDDDIFYVTECVPDSANKVVWITSAYIAKGSTGQLLNMEGSSPQPTPEATFDSSATKDKVPQPEAIVNPEDSSDSSNRLAVTSDYRQILADAFSQMATTQEERELVEKYQLYVKRAKENEARRRKSLTRKHQCTTIKM